MVRSNRINKFHKLIQVLSFKLCDLSNKEEYFLCAKLLLLGESSSLSISKSFSSTDKRNRLSSRLNAWRESLLVKVNFFEINILFQRLSSRYEMQY